MIYTFGNKMRPDQHICEIFWSNNPIRAVGKTHSQILYICPQNIQK